MEEATVISADAPFPNIEVNIQKEGFSHFVIMDGDAVLGILAREWLLAHTAEIHAARALAEVAPRNWVAITRDTSLSDALARMQSQGAFIAAVLPSKAGPAPMSRTCGLITKAQLAESMAEGMELFGD